MHREKLKSIKKRHKGGIMGKPKQHPHMRRNLKREQMMEERFATIEKENRILLEKMSSIMQKSWIDNDGESLPKPRSLQKTQRKFELQRITRENDFILKRIQQREPTYSAAEWERDRKVNERYVRNIVEYTDGAGMGKNRSPKRRGRGSKSTGSLPPLNPECVSCVGVCAHVQLRHQPHLPAGMRQRQAVALRRRNTPRTPL